ncbi:MAG: peptide chain release factor N(5)-glutamine methyltransferase [Patescibacteria group bacterium]|jgi:release factor glutamine methyltransferase
MNYANLLNTATRQLQRCGIIFAQQEALLLFTHVSNKTSEYIIAHPENSISSLLQHKYSALIKRRSLHEPVAYIIKRAGFYGHTFYVDRRVLIPRPETEQLVDIAADIINRRHVKCAIDIGTGSGVIAITLSILFPKLNMLASDSSPEALSVAKRNIEAILPRQHHLRLKSGVLLSSWRHVKSDLIVANLPYLTRAEILNSPTYQELRFEPYKALCGGAGGLNIYRKFFGNISLNVTHQPECVVIEHGWRQCAPLTLLVHRLLPNYGCKSIRDYNNIPRFLIITKLPA